MSQTVRVLIEVDGEALVDYSDRVRNIHFSHSQGYRDVTSALDTNKRYEHDGHHFVVLTYDEPVEGEGK